MARLVAALCPKCGAGVKLDAARDFVTCAYCGTSSFIQREKPAPGVPGQVPPHQPVIYVEPASNHTLLFAVFAGALVLAGSALVYALSDAGASKAANKAPSAPPPPTAERTDKPSVTLGTPVVEAGEPIEGADQVIGAMSAGIRRCYEEALRASPKLRGTFSLHVRVTPSSTQISVRSGELPPAVLECIQTDARSYQFSPQPGTTVLRVDGALKPPSPPPCGCEPGDPLCACQ